LHRIKQIAHFLDKLNELTGRFISWLVLALVLLVSYDVTMRYLFNSGSVALQELEWHLFSVIILLGAAYTFKHDGHVRLDVLYQSRFMSDRKRAWVNLLGDLLLLIPFFHAEASPDPGGLPFRWLLKAMIPLGFMLLLLQGIADLLKNIQTLFGDEP